MTTVTASTTTTQLTLDQQRVEFAKRKFIAMPLAGTIVWLIIGILGTQLPDTQMV
jgi:hypothetical protein